LKKPIAKMDTAEIYKHLERAALLIQGKTSNYKMDYCILERRILK